MARVLMDFDVRCQFNKTAFDVGPGMDRNVRMNRTQFLSLINSYVTDTRGYPQANITLKNGIDTNSQSNVGARNIFPHDPFAFEVVVPPAQLLLSLSTAPDYSACPFADGAAPPREDANLTEVATGNVQIDVGLFQPYCLQSGWDTATEFWVFVSIAVVVGRNTSFVCTPSGTNGNVGGASFDSNYLGLDYTSGGTLFPGATSTISVGDGFISAYFADPGTNPKLLIDSLVI